MKPSNRNQKIDKCRGEFIGKMIDIDIILNMLLSTYIAGEDKFKYCQFMLTKLDMPSKIKIYNQILTKDKNPVFIKYTYRGLLNDIEKMQAIRNLFAHSLAGIHFYGYKKEKAIIANRIHFMNGKDMNKEFFFPGDINDYELKGHKSKIEKLGKIYSSLFDVWHFYNKANPLNE